jgi:hypothetical protein
MNITYKTICAQDTGRLDSEVTATLSEGYQLHGSPYTFRNSNGEEYLCQALTRKASSGVTNELLTKLASQQG